jgi:hypothetical protein
MTSQGIRRRPVVFVHGLWLLPGSRDRWAETFGAAGYTQAGRQRPHLRRCRSPATPSARAIANASFHQQHNEGVTEIMEMKGRGHALTVDSGWREVADTALGFVRRFV